MAGTFSGKGYFTLNDLDDISQKLRSIQQQLQGTLKAFKKGTGDLVHFKTSAAGKGNTGAFVPLTDVGIDVTRTTVNLKKGASVKISFGQDFIAPPVVICSVESADKWMGVVTKVSTTECFISLSDVEGKAGKGQASKTDYLHVVAFGKTKE